MSLSLDRNTVPSGLTVKTYGTILPEDVVFLGDYEISIEDFFAMVYYVLTNTDLCPDDPRRLFVERVKSMTEAEGYNQGGKRLVPNEP